jgi:hypothetical protein
VIFFTFFPLDLVLDDRTSGVAWVGAVPNCDRVNASWPPADAVDVLTNGLNVQAHDALHVAENGMIGNSEWITQFVLLP